MAKEKGKKRLTLSVIKADIGGFPGHVSVHADCMQVAEKCLKDAKKTKLLIDYKVMRCGDDLELIMTHRRGENDEKIHGLAWNTFLCATDVSKKHKLYGAGQDLLSDTFSGNVKGLGPGVCELEFHERESEPVVIFMADKTEPGAWNYPMFKIFADPFNTSGLVIDPSMHDGFIFEVTDVFENQRLRLRCPEEMYPLLAFIGATDKYTVENVYTKGDMEPCASSSTQKLNLIAGKYVGKDDPACIVRAQHGLPAIGEILEPFAFPYLVKGWMRGSHQGPIMPVPFRLANPTRFDGPPRAIAAGFQIAEGRLLGPVDLFDDLAFDHTRRLSGEIAEYMRRHGPFEPHRLPLDQMEYTTLPGVLKKYKGRFEKI